MIKDYIIKIRYKSRQRKLEQFSMLLDPMPDDKILEVGIANKEYSPVDNFLIKQYPYRKNITALGIGDLSDFKKRYPDCFTVSYHGKMFPFHDRQFDIAHANAVIEHVGPLECQKNFLKEMVRVSKRGMITTPNRYFPIELHTKVPILHWMGKEKFDRFLRWIGKDWATGSYMYLLGESELKKIVESISLQRYRIIRNRFFGMTVFFSLLYWNED